MGEGLHRTRGRVAMSVSGALSLLAVVSVLIVVSVPRLRGLAVQENEGDARGTVQALARALAALDASPSRPPPLRELLGAGELRGFGDVELLAGGRVLRRHGYLFEVTYLSAGLEAASAHAAPASGEAVPAGVGVVSAGAGAVSAGAGAVSAGAGAVPGGTLAIRAWPWEHGATGSAAYLATQDGVRLAHSNAGPSWDGLESAGVALRSLDGWRAGGG